MATETKSINLAEQYILDYWKKCTDGNFFTPDSIFNYIAGYFTDKGILDVWKEEKIFRKIAQEIFLGNFIEAEGFKDFEEGDKIIFLRYTAYRLNVISGEVQNIGLADPNNVSRGYIMSVKDPTNGIAETSQPTILFRSSPDSRKIIDEFYKRKGLYYFFEQRRDWTIFNEWDYPVNPNDIQQGNEPPPIAPSQLIPES